MSFRTFRDSQGVEWSAWDVVPKALDRRIADRRLLAEPVSSNRREGQRRLLHGGPRALTSVFAQGWICFETHAEKRRLIPIPADWPVCVDARLEAYCADARRVPAVAGARAG